MDKVAAVGLTKRTIAFLLFLFAIASGGLALTIAGKTPDDFVSLFFAEPEDGNWVAVTFNGQRVAPKTYSILIKRGQIVSGYDGCNDWAYQEQRSGQNAKRMIVMDLKECPDNESRRSYWALVAEPKFVLRDNRQLMLSGKQRRGYFRRCEEDASRTRCTRS